MGPTRAADRAARAPGAKVAYLIPTFQNLIGRTTPAARRAVIAAAAAGGGAAAGRGWTVFRAAPGRRGTSTCWRRSHAPERTIVVQTLSKEIWLGLADRVPAGACGCCAGRSRWPSRPPTCTLRPWRRWRPTPAGGARPGREETAPGSRAHHRRRRDAPRWPACRSSCPRGHALERGPEGGLFIWVRPPGGLRRRRDLLRARSSGARPSWPGSYFYAGEEEPWRNTLARVLRHGDAGRAASTASSVAALPWQGQIEVDMTERPPPLPGTRARRAARARRGRPQRNESEDGTEDEPSPRGGRWRSASSAAAGRWWPSSAWGPGRPSMCIRRARRGVVDAALDAGARFFDTRRCTAPPSACSPRASVGAAKRRSWRPRCGRPTTARPSPGRARAGVRRRGSTSTRSTTWSAGARGSTARAPARRGRWARSAPPTTARRRSRAAAGHAHRPDRARSRSPTTRWSARSSAGYSRWQRTSASAWS